MTQDEVIEMARQAGMSLDICHGVLLVHHVPKDGIEAFAKLVAAKEREACAKVCELESGDGPDNGCCPTYWNEAQESCAAAIRARGEA